MPAHIFYLLVTTGIQALVTMAMATVPVLAPKIGEELGGPAILVGYYAALAYATATMTTLPGGRLVERFGPIRMSQICLGLCAAGLAIGTAGNFAALALSAVVVGAGLGPTTPASAHVLIRTAPAQLMSFTFSVRQTGVPIGVALAGIFVPLLVAGFGWRGALLAVSAYCTVLAAAIQPLRARLDQGSKQPGPPGRIWDGLRIVASSRLLAGMAVGSFFFAGMQHCFVTYIVSYLTADFGMSLAAAGGMLTLAQLGGIISRLVWGVAAERWIRSRLLLGLLGLGMAASALLTAAMTSQWPTALIAGVAALFGATAIGWNGVYLAEVARLVPRQEVSAATGGTLFFTYLGMVVNPLLFGGIVTATGSYGAGFALIALPVAGCAILLLRLREIKKS